MKYILNLSDKTCKKCEQPYYLLAPVLDPEETAPRFLICFECKIVGIPGEGAVSCNVEITLGGGAKVMVDWRNTARCKKCGKKGLWAKTVKNDKWILIVDIDGEWVAHFSDCPYAKDFRR